MVFAMSSELRLHLPPELEPARGEIKAFMDAMLHKLAKNAHKGKWDKMTFDEGVRRLAEELEELQSAATIEGGNTVDIILEAADVANFAMIAASIVIRDAGK